MRKKVKGERIKAVKGEERGREGKRGIRPKLGSYEDGEMRSGVLTRIKQANICLLCPEGFLDNRPIYGL